MNGRPTKEPIHKPWIWVVLAIMVLASIPWYLPPGSIRFVWLGVPGWMWISVVATLATCVFVSWLCFTQWDVVEAEEADERRHRADHPGTEG